MKSVVLPILMAAIGWLFTAAIDDFSDKNVVQYQISSDATKLQTNVLFHNISPSFQTVKFRASFHCIRTQFNSFKDQKTKDKIERCFRKKNTNVYNLNFTPPNSVRSKMIDENEQHLQIEFTISGETSFSIDLNRFDYNFVNDNDDFYFFSLNVDDNDVILLSRNSLIAILISNKTYIYLGLSIIFSALVLFSFIPFKLLNNLKFTNSDGRKIRIT